MAECNGYSTTYHFLNPCLHSVIHLLPSNLQNLPFLPNLQKFSYNYLQCLWPDIVPAAIQKYIISLLCLPICYVPWLVLATISTGVPMDSFYCMYFVDFWVLSNGAKKSGFIDGLNFFFFISYFLSHSTEKYSKTGKGNGKWQRRITERKL